MANVLPNFSNGSALLISIDNQLVAYATNLSFSDDVTTAGVGGLGSFSYDALEPLSYSSRGGFTITHYSKDAMNAVKAGSALSNFGTNGGASQAPKRSNDNPSVFGGQAATSTGNSLLIANSFSPIGLLASRTFDIAVYQRQATLDNFGATTDIIQSGLVFRCVDCRLTSYSISFTPGSLVAEQLGFICIRIEDEQVLNNNTTNVSST